MDHEQISPREHEMIIDGVPFRSVLSSPGLGFPPKNAPEGINIAVLEHQRTGHLFLHMEVDRSGLWGSGLWHLDGDLDESWTMQLDQLVKLDEVASYIERLIKQQESEQ